MKQKEIKLPFSCEAVVTKIPYIVTGILSILIILFGEYVLLTVTAGLSFVWFWIDRAINGKVTMPFRFSCKDEKKV